MSRDLTLGALRRALQALVEQYPVYRTYINACGRPAQDEAFFQQALQQAHLTLGDADAGVLDWLQRWLGGEPWRSLPPGKPRKHLRHACVRFQQLTSPTAAKAVEDTAFYRSAVLLSRNDVGFDAERFSAPPEAFHDACRQRLADFPDNLLGTATHDHKRGEDVRARLAVISERSAWYASRVEHWRELAEPLRQSLADGPAPATGDELMLYQMLLGSWPLGLAADDLPGLKAWAERLHPWQRKALREAKLRSTWSAPNEAYESACAAFLDAVLLDSQSQQLRHSIAEAAAALACPGALNSLAQCLLRMTAPGVPDLYQGNEFWDFSLVDPDNRRPVDFAARRQALNEDQGPEQLLAGWRNGHIKQALIAQVLERRRRYPQLFLRGDYLPLEVRGRHADKVLAFARIDDDLRAVVIVPRLAGTLLGNGAHPLIPAQNWDDTRVVLPFTLSTARFLGLFDQHAVTTHKEPGSQTLWLNTALAYFPVNLFIEHTESSGAYS